MKRDGPTGSDDMFGQGKRTQIEAQASSTASAPSSRATPTPGKQTRVAHEIAMPPATVTGDPLADKATPDGIPAAEGDPNIFLSDAQRRQLIADGANRWLACEQRCHTALAMIRTKALIEPNDPLPFLVAVLIDAASLGVAVGATRVIEEARARGEKLLEDADVWIALGAKPTYRERALLALGRTSPVAIDAALDLGTETGKHTAERDADSAGEAAGEGTKDATDEILASFHDQMAIRFEHLREITPAVSPDSALVAWFRLASAEGPLTEAYFEHMFADKLAEIRADKITDIGNIGGALLGSYQTKLQWRTREGKRSLAVVRAYVSDGCEADLTSGTVIGWVPPEFTQAAIELAEKRGQEIIGNEGDEVPACEDGPSDAAISSAVPL